MWYFSLGWYFRIIGHPIKGLPDNVETSKNARGLSIVYVFILRYSTYLRKTQGWTLHFERPIWEAKNSSAKWPGGHKSNAESKHIYCSFISIHYKLNLPRATDAKPQFASKISSLEVSNSPRPHQPWHTTVENQLGNLASFFKLSLAGDPTVTWHEEIVPWC